MLCEARLLGLPIFNFKSVGRGAPQQEAAKAQAAAVVLYTVSLLLPVIVLVLGTAPAVYGFKVVLG